jgi:osmotically-inducible protein OsmY
VARDDSAGAGLGARVLEAFLNDPVLAERAVEIDADDEGGVILHGTVRSSREVAHAVTMAGGVPGVRAVRQRLRVRTASRR